VAARHLRSGAAVPAPTRRVPVVIRPVEDLTSVFYLSIDVLDRPGVLASVPRVFGDPGVSIRSMGQLGLGDEARLVFLTHLARGGAVTATIEDLGRLDVVDRVGGVLRVVGPEDPDLLGAGA